VGIVAVAVQFHHYVYVSVTNIERSMAFYVEALTPLGWAEIGNYDAATGPGIVPDLYGLGDRTYIGRTGVGSSVWLRRRNPGETGLYLGIVCDSNDAVDAAYATATERFGWVPRLRSCSGRPAWSPSC
jgi:hypothetical protein